MKAWLLDELTGLGKLRLAETAEPVPRRGEVVLRVRYAALNPADRYLAEGQYPARPALPHILGRDGVGRVMAVGPGVTRAAVGDEVTLLRGETGVSRPGLFAEYAAVSEEYVMPCPAGWSAEEAAAAPLVYLTAYQALTMWGDLPPGVVLVSGASGGVGIAAVQLGRAMGHKVIALSRSEAHRQRLMHMGAALALDPQADGWPRQALEALAGRRVDLAIDNIGGALLPQMIQTLGEHGKVSVVGRLAGPVPQFNTASLFFRRLRLGGVSVGAYTAAESRAAWQAALALLEGISARPVVDRVYPFDQLPAAFARLAGSHLGKVLLEVWSSRNSTEVAVPAILEEPHTSV